jgi:hypothetical protein
MVEDPNCAIADCITDNQWWVEFRRSLSASEYNTWSELLGDLQTVVLTSAPDTVIWALESNKNFSTKSLYRFLTDRGIASKMAGFIWKAKLPLKIRVFLWQNFNNKLQVAQSLIKRGWKGSKDCCLCGKTESVEHIFFKCHIAKFVWSIIGEVFRISVPRSLDDLSLWIQGKGPFPSRMIMFMFAGFAWAIWTTRNKMAIEKKFPKAPTDVIYCAISILQKWRLLLKEGDKKFFDQAKDDIMKWIKGFQPSKYSMSDILEI